MPMRRFYNSSLQEISGIEGVTKMYSWAFAGCDIQKITWPDGCDTIPYECFMNSKLEQIDNIDNVKEIHDRAFANSRIQSMDLSRTICLTVYRHAFRGIERKKIILPYYIMDEDWNYAFDDFTYSV